MNSLVPYDGYLSNGRLGDGSTVEINRKWFDAACESIASLEKENAALKKDLTRDGRCRTCGAYVENDGWCEPDRDKQKEGCSAYDWRGRKN